MGIKLIPPRESLLSGIPARDGNVGRPLFLRCNHIQLAAQSNILEGGLIAFQMTETTAESCSMTCQQITRQLTGRPEHVYDLILQGSRSWKVKKTPSIGVNKPKYLWIFLAEQRWTTSLPEIKADPSVPPGHRWEVHVKQVESHLWSRV